MATAIRPNDSRLLKNEVAKGDLSRLLPIIFCDSSDVLSSELKARQAVSASIDL